MKTCLPCAVTEALGLPEVKECSVCEEKKIMNSPYDVTCPDCQTVYYFNPVKPTTCPGCGIIFPSKSKKDPDKALDTQIGGTHYMEFAIQPVEFIERNKLTFLEGCVIKRICRYKKKDKLADLKKAIDEIKKIAKLTYDEEI
jgi:Protein of unknwon function (DUF3310)